MRVSCLAGWLASFAVAAGASAADEVTWTPGASLAEVIERIAAVRGESYVLDEPVRMRSSARGPAIFPASLPVGLATRIVEEAADLESWRRGGVAMWFAAGQRPGLLTAQWRLARSEADPTAPARLAGTIELEGAATAEAMAAIADAFGVVVVCPAGLPEGPTETSLLADGIDLPTAVAIVAESCHMVSRIEDGFVVFTVAEVPAVEDSDPLDQDEVVDARVGDVDSSGERIPTAVGSFGLRSEEAKQN